MSKVILVARILLGLMFFVFGLNGILHFLPMPPMPDNDASRLAMILTRSHWMTFVALLQVIGGLLLLVGAVCAARPRSPGADPREYPAVPHSAGAARDCGGADRDGAGGVSDLGVPAFVPRPVRCCS